MVLKAITAVVEAVSLRFRLPQTSPCQQTAVATGIGLSLLSGATMKAPTDTKRFTTENLTHGLAPKRSKEPTPTNRNDARP
jgi:hypothetical protein